MSPNVNQTNPTDRTDALGLELRPLINDKLGLTMFFWIIGLLVTICGAIVWFTLNQIEGADLRIKDLEKNLTILETKFNAVPQLQSRR